MSRVVFKSLCSKSLGLGILRHTYKYTLSEKCYMCASQNIGRYNILKPLSSSRYFSKSTLSADDTRQQVYYGILSPQIRAVKLFSLVTSITGLVAQPILFYHGSSFGGLPLLIAAGTVVGFFTFVTPFLLHIITKKYVSELLYNPSSSQYTAVVYNFFLRRKEIVFRPEDVVVPDVPGMFTSFVAKGVPLFVEARLFEEPQHFAKIMGYDKPIDFKLEDITSEKHNKT